MDQFKEKLDFFRSRDKLIAQLDNRDNLVMTLGTSANNKVITRAILIINNEMDLYFFTWRNSRKIKQIEMNINVGWFSWSVLTGKVVYSIRMSFYYSSF